MNQFTQIKPIHSPERNRKLALALVEKGVSEDAALRAVEEEISRNQNMWENDTYNVIVREAEIEEGSGFPEMIWLSIKRLDKEPIHDWRDLQEIKNQLIGEENEAVELYPSESRLVDQANQYHLFVLKDSAIKFPFGFKHRVVGTSEEARNFGGKQRERGVNIVGAHMGIGHGHSMELAREVIRRTGVSGVKGSVLIIGANDLGKTTTNEIIQRVAHESPKESPSPFVREPMVFKASQAYEVGLPKSGQEGRRERRKNKKK
jgi:hypothetical protein